MIRLISILLFSFYIHSAKAFENIKINFGTYSLNKYEITIEEFKKYAQKNNKNIKIKIFDFHVKIKRSSYLNMIRQKYISVLLDFNKEELVKGIREINLKYHKILKFVDSLNCVILKND